MIKKEYEIKATKDHVWSALTDSKYIHDWGGGSAKMSPRVDYKFSLWGGDIWGKNILVVPGQKLVQEWFTGDWPKPSKVTFRLSEKDGITYLKLTQTGVPKTQLESISRGWDDYYIGPIKNYLEGRQYA